MAWLHGLKWLWASGPGLLVWLGQLVAWRDCRMGHHPVWGLSLPEVHLPSPGLISPIFMDPILKCYMKVRGA